MMLGTIRFIKSAAVIITLLALTAHPSMAQRLDPIYQQFGIEMTAEPASIAPGGEGTLVIRVDIPIGYTLTDDESVFGIEPVPTPGIVFGKLARPEHFEVDEDGMGHWIGIIEFRIPFSAASDAQIGECEVDVKFLLQACEEESGVCKFPGRVTRSFKLVVAGQEKKSAVPEEEKEGQEAVSAHDEPDEAKKSTADSDEPEQAKTAGISSEVGDGTEADTAPDETEEPQESSVAEASLEESFKNWLQDAIDSGYLWLAFIIAFGAGVLTSLTPCVYPMIPITISYVSGRAQGEKKSGFFISLTLVLGIIITYSALGVFAALAGQTFGAITQNLYVQAAIFIVLVVMGFSMLGAFEVALPSSLQQKMSVQRQGYLGALIIGLTLGFVAAPCVAPILIPILALIATSGNLVLGVLLMTVYALGMGVLFILVGTFSNIVLPKSGEWMNWLKKIFAFVLFLLAIYFAQDLIQTIPIHENLVQLMTGAVLVLFGVVVGAFLRLEADANWWKIVGKASGILLLTTGLILFSFGIVGPMLPAVTPGVTSSGPAGLPSPNWIKKLDAGLEQAEMENKPVLIDFWADWCTNCKLLDKKTFSDPRVIEELERFVVIKIDGSETEDPDYVKAVEKYDVTGLPTVIIKDSEGEIVHTFNSFLDAEAVLSLLKDVD